MLKKVVKSELKTWVKTVEIVEITENEVMGLISGCSGTTPVMTTEYEKPEGIELGDIYLYDDFRHQPPMASIAHPDSPLWNDPNFARQEQHSGVLLIRRQISDEEE